MHTTTAGSRSRHTPNIARLAAALLLCTTLASATACGGGDSTTGPRAGGPSTGTQPGLYALMQVNAKAIPAEIKHGPFLDGTVVPPRFYNLLIVKITGGELVLQNDGRFHFAVDFYVNRDGTEATVTRPVDGTWEVDGNEITLTPNGSNGYTTATLGKGSISMDLDLIGEGKVLPYSFQYRK
jgi:hypothetical protein